MVVTSHLNDVFLAPAVCSQGMRAEMVRREGQHHLRGLPSGLSFDHPMILSDFFARSLFLTVLSMEVSPSLSLSWTKI